MNAFNTILLNTNLLAVFTIMHFYWLFGGTNSVEYFISPNHIHGRKKIRLKKPRLLVRSIALAIMTWFCFQQIVNFDGFFTHDHIVWGNRVIAVIFLVRAFGNFTYIGFTKTIRKSTFANIDTYLISPLCLIIAICAFFNTF